MTALFRRLCVALLLTAVAFLAAGCEDQGGPPKKSANTTAKKDGPKKSAEDAPRVEEKYGFTTQQVGP